MNTPLSSFLLSHPFLMIIIGFLFSILVQFLPRTLRWIFLFVYAAFIIYMTLLFRSPSGSRGVFEIFWSYRQFFSNWYYRLEIMQNIWLFIPLGAILYSISGKPSIRPNKRWLMLLPLALSIVIEVIQYFTGVGVAEIDDIISNTLGGVIGFYLGYLIRRSQKLDR